jgi:predicted permease
MIVDRFVSDVTHRLRAIFRRDAVEKELDDELALHLEMETEKLIRSGMPKAEAARQARLSFGGMERIKDDTRDARGVRWLDIARQDIRYATRQLARSPLFTFTSAVSLGIGIAVTVAAFSMINAVIFKPLQIPDAASLVAVTKTYRSGESNGGVSYDDLEDLRATGAFQSLGGAFDWGAKATPTNAAPENVMVTFVSPNLFDVLGIRPAQGRSFGTAAGQPEVIISERYRAHIAPTGEPVVGTTIRINNTTFTIVGVAPKSFAGLTPYSRTSFWLPESTWPLLFPKVGFTEGGRGVPGWSAYGRLADGITKEEAAVRLNMVAKTLADRYPTEWREFSGKPRIVSVLSPRKKTLQTTRGLPLLLMSMTGLVAIVLILGCTNVAGLLLTRAVTRRHEIALRLTLGASRTRLIRQLLTESILLAFIGGFVGLVCAEWALRFAARVPYFAAFNLSPDWRILAATAGVCMLCAIVFGVTPTIHALRVDLKSGMSGHGSIGERGGVRARLMALQVCLAFLLIMLGFSASRGIRSQLRTSPGFNVNGLLVIDPGRRGFERDDWSGYLDETAKQLRTIDGVTHVMRSRRVPMDASDWKATVSMPSGPAVVGYEPVDTAYFATIGVHLLQGRLPRASEVLDARRPAVVNRAMTKALGHDVLGGTLRIDNNREVVVVGVVEDLRHHEVELSPEPYLYELRDAPAAANDKDYIIARVQGGTETTVTNEFIHRMRDHYPNRVPPIVSTLRSRLEVRLEPQRYMAGIAFAVGMIELALAAIGLYSLLLYATLTRTREIGVRMALGAAPRDASFTVMREGLLFAGGGLLLGIVLSIPAAMLAARGLFLGARAADPVPLAAAAAGIILATAAATLVPARHAARVEPMVALRHD